MCSSGGSQEMPAVLPEAPQMAESTGTSSKSADAKRRAAATGSGASSTILTSSRGTTNGAATANKTLLGE